VELPVVMAIVGVDGVVVEKEEVAIGPNLVLEKRNDGRRETDGEL
jgi:hypothetical protein